MNERKFEPVTLQPATSGFGAENDDRTIIYGYMCKVDFECELGCALGGNTIYPSIKNLRERRGCVDQCGIVKVAVVAVDIVQETNYNWDEDEEEASE